MSDIKSPLARLVLVMICLSIAGTVVAAENPAIVDPPLSEYGLSSPCNDDSICVYGLYNFLFCPFLHPGGQRGHNIYTGELACCYDP